MAEGAPVAARVEDPLLKSARREAVICGVVWLLATAYSVIYCWFFGYERSLESLRYVFGFPDWIFWGVIMPWGVCTLFSAWFCMYFMTDEDLGAEPESQPVTELETLG